MILGKPKTRAPQMKARFRIEGDTVTYSEIAKRLGISRTAAEQRMRRLRGASGPVTWKRLQRIAA
jgi:hypothetical protein